MTDQATRIVRAGPQDADTVRRLVLDAYRTWVPVIGREPLPMLADYDAAVVHHQIDLLHVGSEVVALIETVHEVDHLLVENVAVAPAFQGRGLGRTLLAHAEDVARSAGYGELRLYTNKLFAVNLRLYGSVGYRVSREEEFRGGIVVHLTKRLS